jgi:Mce-associated membrane protein
VNRTRLVVGGLVVALVASLVALVLVWRDRDDADDLARSATEMADAGVEAERVAAEVITRMTTYNFRTVEEDFSWVDDVGTAKFRDNYAAISKETAIYIQSLKAKAKGVVVDSSATVADPDHVKVLLFVDQTIRAEGTKQLDFEQTRVTMQMVREGETWLVDEVEVTNLLTPSAAR